MSEGYASRVRRKINQVIRYDAAAEAQNKKPSEPPKPKPPRKQRAAPKPQPERDIDEVYAIPEQSFVRPRVTVELPSLDKLMAMSLDELENLETAGTSQELFDSKSILFDMREAAKEIELRDDDYDFASYQEALARQAQITETEDYCPVSIPNEITSLPLYKMIVNGDVDKYFQFIANGLKRNCERTDCLGRCLNAVFKSEYMRGTPNPMHIAAANNKAAFIREVTVNFEPKLQELNVSEEQIYHYNKVVDQWISSPTTSEYAMPLVIAAEFDHVNCISYLICDSVLKILATDSRCGRPARHSYASYFERSAETLLATLAFNNRFDYLQPKEFDCLLNCCSKNDLLWMFGDALSNGSFEAAKVLLKRISAPVLFGMEQYRPTMVGRTNERGYVRVQRMKPLQWALYHGHSKVFDEFPICVDFKYDQYGYTPLLMCAFSLDDKSLRETLDRYRLWVDREDYFVFLYQLILANRFNFARIELEYALNVYDRFKPRNGLDLDYGLPLHVVLPMSGALAANKDMSVIEGIREIYMRFHFHETGKMIDEDIIRCYEYIQYFNFKFSQQVRLAVILMLIRLTPVQNDRWLEIMHRHIDPMSEGGVSRYVLESFHLPGQCERTPVFTWREALEQAAEIVEKWNGTMEVSNDIESLAQARIKVRSIKQEIGEYAPPEDDNFELVGILKRIPQKYNNKNS